MPNWAPIPTMSMMSWLNKIETRLAAAVPLQVYRQFVRRPVIGLVYHAVSDDPLPHLRHLYPSKTTQAFEQDLRYLKRHAELIPFDRVADALAGGPVPPSRSLLMTFDDGYAECFHVIRPLLLRHGVPAVFFVTTSFLDNQRMFYRNKASLCLEALQPLAGEKLAQIIGGLLPPDQRASLDLQMATRWVKSLAHDQEPTLDRLCARLGVDVDGYLQDRRPYLTRDQVETLVREGFTIGAHSRTHAKFNRLTPAEIEREILESCRAIQAITGADQVPFAFPFSGVGIDRPFLARLRDRHPVIGPMFDSRGFQKDAPFVVHRVWADPPPPPGATESNLPARLHQAYQEYALWRRRYLTAVLKARLAPRDDPPGGSTGWAGGP